MIFDLGEELDHNRPMSKIIQKRHRVFLSAGWHNLLLFNYKVSPDVLAPLLPEGCELDLLDGSAYLSLVAFEFLRTKVVGIKWPGFVNFPEINLRFYVQYNGERGVCFVKEYVPSPVVAQIARVLYNEPYKHAQMASHIQKVDSRVDAEYTLRDGDHKMRCFVSAASQPRVSASDSIEHHFKEHELGVGKSRAGRVLTYRVHHPVWRTYPVLDYQIDVDAEGLYGKSFGFLSQSKPDSVVFAEGSEIKVFYKDV